MTRVRTLVPLRVVAVLGIAASAVLSADARRPDRGFCPLESACLAARESPLGRVLNVPTSSLGMLAFAGLLALTFSRGPRSLLALRVAATLAAAVGTVLLLYQALALGTFCPFCLVADLSGIAAGFVAWRMTPEAIPVPAGAPGVRRAWTPFAWAVGGALVAAAPFLVTSPKSIAAWIPLAHPGVSGAEAEGPNAGIDVVEYLNPFCPHCRKTHAHLARVLESVDVPVRRTRLYVWASGAAPLWARACVCAQDQSLERPFFRELLTAQDEGDASIRAAARRAGLDVDRLMACAAGTGPNERLSRVHGWVMSARIEGRPTLDIGRRRLQGEASEAELREAVAAAVADLGTGPSR